MGGYWSQFSKEEIDSMHGIEPEDYQDDEDVDDSDERSDEEKEEDRDRCPRCGGGGCNYCLMLDY